MGLFCTSSNNCDQCAKNYWKYIKYKSSGSNTDYGVEYVNGDNDPGSGGDDVLGLKWVTTNGNHWELVKGSSNVTSNENASKNCKLTDVKATSDITIPHLLYDTGLFEIGPYTDDYKNQWFWANGGTGTFYPRRGADCITGSPAGSFTVSFSFGRMYASTVVGFFKLLFKYW